MSLDKFLIGDTIKFTWINSGVSMAPTMEVITGSETVVATGSFVDSGNGHYYYKHTVNSAGYHILKGTATFSEHPYVRQLRYKGVTGGVD